MSIHVVGPIMIRNMKAELAIFGVKLKIFLNASPRFLLIICTFQTSIYTFMLETIQGKCLLKDH